MPSLTSGWKITSTAVHAVLLAAGLLIGCSLSGHAEQNAKGNRALTDDLNAVFKEQPCTLSKSVAQLDAPVPRLARRLAAHEPVTIVAIGSSSTGGAGASSPAFSYPSRLERELHARFPDAAVTVINRGINGEEAADMMGRMNSILEAKPDLVIWQLGTNAVLRDGSIPATEELLHKGITQIRKSGADILLIDPQFAPQVNAKPAVKDMVGMIGYVAKLTHVPLFRRYVAMRHWHEDEAISFDRFISADGLHMNDWGYSCLARMLADNLAATVARSQTVADVKPFQ